MGPLAACKVLQHLNCNTTRVADLSPLYMSSLHTLDCRYTLVADVGPLVACTSLISVACPPRVPYEQHSAAARGMPQPGVYRAAILVVGMSGLVARVGCYCRPRVGCYWQSRVGCYCQPRVGCNVIASLPKTYMVYT